MFYTVMNIILNILNIFVLIRTLSFSMYEIKNNDNKTGGVVSIVVGLIVFFLILYVLWLR